MDPSSHESYESVMAMSVVFFKLCCTITFKLHTEAYPSP